MNISQTTAPHQEHQSKSDLRLTARYRWLMFLITLPLFIVVAVMAISQYRDQRQEVINDLSQNSVTYTIALEGIAKLANDHVLQMREWHERYLVDPHQHPSVVHEYFRPSYYGDGSLDAFTLDDLPEKDRRYIGQVPWLAGYSERNHTGKAVLDQAMEFFTLVRLTHNVTPHFQWSYYFSSDREFTYIYPWTSTQDLLKGSGHKSIKEAISAWFTYEIYLAGTPEQNPQRAPYWTAPYMDAGGTGAMVSHGAPVYIGDKFYGIVGTDVRLITLEQFLLSLPREVGRLLILDDKESVLADSAGSPTDAIRKAEEVLPVGIDNSTLALASQYTQKRLQAAGHTIIVRKTKHAPWTLAYLVSDQEIIDLLFPRFFPYGVIMAVLALTFFFALYLLRREFISPALALVRYIQNVSLVPAAMQPDLPQLWQPWVKVVSRTFTENREANNMLCESEARLQQILNNSSAVFYVRDMDERFLMVNVPFERLLNVSHDEVIGKQLEEVFPAHTAAQFRGNDMHVVEKNMAIEFEECLTLEDGLHTYLSIKFPLYDTEGKIYAICGMSTDISKRKRTEEILRQTALGISQAQGEGVFNSLVAHLAKAVGTDLAFIGILEGHDRIRTRALTIKGRIEENITYPLADSPCENVVGQRYRFYPDTIQQRFPKDTLLQEIKMESYAAIPLFDSCGEVLGLLAVLHSQPLKDEELIESILQVFSGRAASELERERTDAALRASEASYRAIFEASEDAIFVHDLESGDILDVNSKACNAYGYSSDEIRKLDVGAISSGTPPYTQEYAMQLISRAVQGEQMRFEWHRKNKDGSLHWDDVFIKRASIGGTDRILVFTREITERKHAEERLRASEEQYRAIFNASSDALILWDTDGNIVDTNRTTWLLGGYTQEEFMAVPLREHVHASSLAAFEDFMDAINHGREFEIEGKVIRKDGAIMELEMRGVLMQYRGRPHTLTIARDITEQKRASEELARQRDALRQNEKLSAMGALVANVAHELNNPLAILMGRAALLEKKLLDTSASSEAHKIRNAAERCGRIVRTFLGMARQRPAERRPASLNDVVSGALDLLGYGLRTSGISVNTRLADNLPLQEMDGDQIGQVVINLLVNAQHATSEQSGKRLIEIETRQCGTSVCLRVSDNGSGVPADIRDRIFDPFFTTKPEGLGTGVGLAVSRAIMREHQGDLQLEDSESGATFKLWLPLDKLTTVSDVLVIQNASSENIREGCVLVVDDELEISSLLADILRSAGFVVIVVNSGEAALNWLRDNNCDFILSDVRMPGLDGPALWRIVKDRYPKLVNRMAFVTGDTLSASIAPFLKECELPWLEKPFSPEQVLELIARLEEV